MLSCRDFIFIYHLSGGSFTLRREYIPVDLLKKKDGGVSANHFASSFMNYYIPKKHICYVCFVACEPSLMASSRSAWDPDECWLISSVSRVFRLHLSHF